MKFFRNMYQKSKEQKGFTLVEMIVVLVIIAILAAITIPALLKYIDKAKDKQLVINARTAYLAAETAASEAYAAGYDDDKQFTFPTADAKEDDNEKKVTENAKNLAGLSGNYSCTVTTDGKWKIEKVMFETKKSDGKTTDKTAVLDVKNGSDWTVN